ncbi:MAG: hypothetical protein KJ070_12985 [Verrucomicrobia bacterium]|nr:hypothetical protein [Verrucomicrobiota bacterium]
MKTIIRTITLAAALLALPAPAQNTTVMEPIVTTNSPVPIEEPKDEGWSFGVSAYQFFVPDDNDYFQPTITLDHKWLHLEGRYNYEDLHTASFWAGYNFGGGETVAWEFTPMLGGVFGDTAGLAPGYKGSVSWWWLELYSEGEYLFDSRDSSDSFFYNWSELTLNPVDWFRIGMVTQRTKVYETDRDIQRGLLVGFTFKRWDFTTYVLNPDRSEPTVALAVSFGF